MATPNFLDLSPVVELPPKRQALPDLRPIQGNDMGA